jgi:hypothetical protein
MLYWKQSRFKKKMNMNVEWTLYSIPKVEQFQVQLKGKRTDSKQV